MKPTARISAAKLATAQMDDLLRPALDELRSALNVTGRSGVFADVAAVRAALVHARAAIDQSLRIARRADWPLSPAARRRIIANLSAGIAQSERRYFPSGDPGDETLTPLHPSDEVSR